MGLREELLQQFEPVEDKVTLSTGKQLTLCKVSGVRRDTFEIYVYENELQDYASAMWVAMCAFDSGEFIFEKEDITAIGNAFSSEDLRAAFNKAKEVNGASEAQDEATKNG